MNNGEKSTGPGEFNFIYISPLKSLHLVLIPRAKLDDHRGSWTGCLHAQRREKWKEKKAERKKKKQKLKTIVEDNKTECLY